MDQFKEEMMQMFQAAAQRNLDILCPTWVKLFGFECESFCKTQLESHLESFFKQIVDENATKEKDFTLWINSKLSATSSNRPASKNNLLPAYTREISEIEGRLGVASSTNSSEGPMLPRLKRLKAIVTDLRARSKIQDDKVSFLILLPETKYFLIQDCGAEDNRAGVVGYARRSRRPSAGSIKRHWSAFVKSGEA